MGFWCVLTALHLHVYSPLGVADNHSLLPPHASRLDQEEVEIEHKFGIDYGSENPPNEQTVRDRIGI